MRTVKGLYYFYIKLLIPSIVLSFVLSCFYMNRDHISAGTGISFILLTPTFHYFTYEIKNSNEYYFYHNLGFSKLNLWLITVFISISLGFIITSL